MQRFGIGEQEMRFAKLLWEREGIGSGEVVKLCEKELGWKSSDKHKHSINIAQNYDHLLTDLLSGRMREAKEEMPVTKNRLARKYYTMRQRMANAERIRRYSPSYARHMVATTLLHGASRLFAKDRHWE